MAIEIKDGFNEETPVDEVTEASAAEEADEEILTGDVQDETEDVEEAESAVNTEPSEKEGAEAAEEGPEAAEEGQPEKSEDTEKAQKKSLFGKKKEKKDKRDEKIDELTDLLKRNMAEFDNFRKRTEKEKAAMYEVGARSIIEKLLPVVDNFERGLATVSEEDKEKDSFANGMDLVYKQILKLFEDLEVKVIETEGKEFDPNLHNAVMHIEDENLGENMIAQEFQKGYTYRGTVIRHSMVQVAN